MNEIKLTPAQKGAITRRENAGKRRAKQEQILQERRLLGRALTAILDSPNTSDREKLKASELLLKARGLLP